MTRRLLVRAAIAGGAATAAGQAWRRLRDTPPGGAALWDRTNHRGETVSLLEGPAFATAAAAAVALAPGLPGRVRAAAVVATAGGAVFGAIDDLRESGTSKGLRGHLGELARGRLTTGGLKVLGIGATGLAAALLTPPAASPAVIMETSAPEPAVRRPLVIMQTSPANPGGRAAAVAGLLLDGALVAGAANLLNLFDLRPGRALKVVLLFAPAAAAAGPAGPLVAAAGGAAAGLLPVDLSERAMLGDTGANAAGALLGAAAVAGLGRGGRLAVLLGVAALTLASEKVSFTAVIARTPVLREFDALGRRPAAR